MKKPVLIFLLLPMSVLAEEPFADDPPALEVEDGVRSKEPINACPGPRRRPVFEEYVEITDVDPEELTGCDTYHSAPEQTLVDPAPLNDDEEKALSSEVAQCWNVGALSSGALQARIVIGLSVERNGKPDNSSLHLIEVAAGTDNEAEQAFQAARRAIIRCGSTGLSLPPSKYAHWKNLELQFDLSGISVR
jgi:hypothetical protein